MRPSVPPSTSSQHTVTAAQQHSSTAHRHITGNLTPPQSCPCCTRLPRRWLRHHWPRPAARPAPHPCRAVAVCCDRPCRAVAVCCDRSGTRRRGACPALRNRRGLRRGEEARRGGKARRRGREEEEVDEEEARRRGGKKRGSEEGNGMGVRGGCEAGGREEGRKGGGRRRWVGGGRQEGRGE